MVGWNVGRWEGGVEEGYWVMVGRKLLVGREDGSGVGKGVGSDGVAVGKRVGLGLIDGRGEGSEVGI
jgi:hypothetical protein